MTSPTTPTPTPLRIEIDRLEYTREGLRTREPLDLSLGYHNRVVIVRPPRIRPLGQGARGFPHDSAYPLMATLSTCWSLAKVHTPFTHHATGAPAGPKTALQVFAHTSASGDEAYNKRLSERRAKVGLALLRSDAAALLEVADEDGWGVREAQAMLRTLACDPGPIDDELGPFTESAISTFQERYAAGVYHRRHGATPSHAVETDGQWNDATKDALFDAFVHAHGAAVVDADVHPTHPAHGCSEFNAFAPDVVAENRRLTVIAHPTLPEHHANAPCTVGDDGACAVVDDAPQRCMWFREHVAESTEAPVEFVDPRWLWLGEDRYLLSALTNLAGDAEVEFEAYDAEERVRGQAAASGAWLESPRSEVLSGKVWRGVAQVVWSSGTVPDAEDGRPPFDHFPVFRVRDPQTGAYTFAPWPERSPLRIIVGSVDSTETKARPTEYRLEAGDGSYEAEVPLADAEPGSTQHVVVVFDDVPLDTRVTLRVGADGRWPRRLLSNVMANTLPGNCSSGDQCRELPLPKSPPDPPSPQEIDEDEDESIPWLEGDPEEFEEPSYE